MSTKSDGTRVSADAPDQAASVASEVERLANAILAQWPWSLPSPTSPPVPAATASPGAVPARSAAPAGLPVGGAPVGGAPPPLPAWHHASPSGALPSLGALPDPAGHTGAAALNPALPPSVTPALASVQPPAKPTPSLDPSTAVGPLSQLPPVLPTSYGAPAPQAATLAPLPPPRLGPSALNVGAGGASPALSLPPVPGALKEPPLANAPPPRESDLRSLVTVYAENVHGTSSVPLLASVESGPPAAPYFLDLAGVRDQGAPYFLQGHATPDPAGPGVSPSAASAPSLASLPGSAGALPGAPAGAFPEAQHGFSLDLPAAPTVEPPPLSLGSPAALAQAPSSSPFALAQLPSSSPFALAQVPSASPVALVQTADNVSALPLHGAHAVTSTGGISPSGHLPELVRAPAPGPRGFDAYAVKQDFPILRERVHGKRLVWLDNAATTQKPLAVIDRISYFYEHENSNIHRAAHTLAARSTDAYEGARDTVHRFLNTPSKDEVIFVRGATEGINLIAQSWGRRFIGPGDEIVLTWLEHHANIVPWQQLAAEKGARLRVVPVDDSGQVLLSEYEKLLGPRTRLVSMPQVSNALGTIVPVREMIQIAHRYGAATLVDGAQAVSHMPVDVQQLDCDFYVFSGHKVFAPTGIGAVYGKPDRLEAMPPWQGGGNMIADVTFEQTTYQPPPQRFEAGTASIGDAVGLAAALDYLSSISLQSVSDYEHELLVYGTQRLAEVPGLRMIGTAPDKAGVMSFIVDGLRTEEVGSALDRDGIAVRAGHHCAQPILRRFGLEATVRASLAPYNTREDLDALAEALARLVNEARGR